MRPHSLFRRARNACGKLPCEPVVLVVLGLAALALWGFVELADEVVEGETRSFDHAVLRFFRVTDDPGTLRGHEWYQTTVRDVTALGDTFVLALVVLIVVGYLLLLRKFAFAVLVLAAALLGQAVSSVLKVVFGRERPDVVPHLTDVATASFPSGHAMMSAVVYLTLGALLAQAMSRRAIKLYFLGVAIFLTVIVGLSRVILGVHYPTDVLAGWLVGAVWATLWWTVARTLARRGAIAQPTEEGIPT